MILNKQHLTDKGLADIRMLQKQINNNNSSTNKTGDRSP